jgi:hypothetical protein
MALNFNKVFTPHKANTVNLTPTTSTSRVALNEQLVGTQAIGGVRVLNNTGTIAFIKLGDSSVTATTNDTPLGSGAIELFGLNGGDTHCAAIIASGTASGAVYLTHGEGV